eukprot:TRINITY_DN540_c0_g1_i2.p1 TRINITY_DN540_c0_g1~~TRINITY_DN540_c0_g1_i2.p1  ORF type:complete len:504 (+),score=81.55 TRINITY_DN540_c0_g1_i2:55-1566(+)
MDFQVGESVREKSSHVVGVVEKKNSNQLFVNFNGVKPGGWRKAGDLVLASTPVAPAAAAPRPQAFVVAKPSGKPSPQPNGPSARPGPSSSPAIPTTTVASTPAPIPNLSPSPSSPTVASTAVKPTPKPASLEIEARPALNFQPSHTHLQLTTPSVGPPRGGFQASTRPVLGQAAVTPGQRASLKAARPSLGPMNPGMTVPAPAPAPQHSVKDVTWDIAFDELEIEHTLGSGKFGEVYYGFWLGTPVAIKKILDPDNDSKKAIEREVTMLKGVRHPNIVQFLGLCTHKGDIYFITEFVDKGDLFDALIFGDTPLSWKDKLNISMDVAQACYYMQVKGILHRDLKSQNILLSSSKKAKLCDLGLARALEDTINKRLTFVGTDRWMAPEICMSVDYDYKVDVFSYGVVLVEIITGAVPDERRPGDKFALNEQGLRAKVLPGCPPAFVELCVDCTRFDPASRPSFKQILQRVKKIFEEQPDDSEDAEEGGESYQVVDYGDGEDEDQE